MHPPLLEASYRFLFAIPKDTDQIVKLFEAASMAVDFGFNVGLAEFEKSMCCGK